MSTRCDIVILRNKERVRYLKRKKEKKELLCCKQSAVLLNELKKLRRNTGKLSV